ncbi:apolipoprotein N-acyltransferase [Pollutimonas thiosulfatoxidans]|uniref:apolipoprotein N-acyltransferase n=1 Tax=Pollutimonas thiosulfatoxidans TaxID=2028345 RepID=UPI0013E2FBA0|nr:apolipoprotein N-acyltransferase [Pollutimonas thiosulfatoxidans]
MNNPINRLRGFSRWHARLLGLGAIHALSFSAGPLPHWSLPFVQVFSLAILAFHVFRSTGLQQAAVAGFLFGLSNFGLGLYWLYISMHEYGGMFAPLAATAVLLLAAGLALFIAFACALTRWLSAAHLTLHTDYRRQLLIATTWASAWMLTEWLRGTMFTGFPWMNIGYAHVEGVLAGWAPLTGVYGVAWLAAFAAAAIALLACAKDTENDAKAAIGVGLTILAGLAGIALTHVGWSRPLGEPMIIRLVQGNVPQSEKFDPQLVQQGIATYMKLAALPPKEASGEPDLIVLPETVMPMFQDRIPPATWRQWLDIANARDASLIMGIPLHDAAGGNDRYTNSAIGFDAATPLNELMTGQTAMRYDKQHLVPFGEFVPPGFRWFVDAMSIPLGDFDQGAARQPAFKIDDQMIAPDICYEDVFGEEIILSVRNSEEHGPGASILVNMSNLGWFGDSWALRQHLQISRMRAIETARPMIRATNTGMTAAIGPDGAVRAAIEPMRLGVLDVEVQGMHGQTPYVRLGNLPALVWALLFLLLGFALRKRSA